MCYVPSLQIFNWDLSSCKFSYPYILRAYLNKKVTAPALKTEINGRGDPLR
jgi:hypothetical protein